jgi:single-strand DNA-binding protein
MSQENSITLRGFVASDPKFRQTTNKQMAVTEIRVGSTPRRLNRETGEWQDGQTSFYTVKCWRRLAVNAKGSLHKGDMIVVRGRFYMNSWLDNEQKVRNALEIEADSIGHDLTYGHTIFTRGSRVPAGSMAGLNEGEHARQDVPPSDSGEAGDDDMAYHVAADGDVADVAASEPSAAELAELTREYASADAAGAPF